LIFPGYDSPIRSGVVIFFVVMEELQIACFSPNDLAQLPSNVKDCVRYPSWISCDDCEPEKDCAISAVYQKMVIGR
jgi:hypothetical protein